MPSRVHVIPDTNVFLQCKPLSELDWSYFRGSEEIIVILTHPVVSEIDKHKKSGTRRLAKKSRAANKLIGEIIDSTDSCVEKITKSKIKLKIKYLPTLPKYEHESLSTKENDDKIVSIAKAYSEENITEKVYLITNDNGPMLKAKMVGLTFFRTPESWMLQPEKDDGEKELDRFKKELEKMQYSFPKIIIENKKMEFSECYYEGLSGDEINRLMEKIKTHIPMASNFEQTELDKLKAKSLQTLSNLMTFAPATEDEIDKYKKEDYPAWIEKCEEHLKGIHGKLNRSIYFPSASIWIENTGGQPARETLVKFSPKGNFKLLGKDEIDNGSENIENTIELPKPPAPPRGVWRDRFSYPFVKPFQFDENNFYHSLPAISLPDSNCFYWDERKSTEPGGYLSLTCKLWRHGIGEEEFSFYILPEEHDDNMTGAIICEVHADNLPTPTIETIPVKILLPKKSCYELASEEVNKLISDYQH